MNEEIFSLIQECTNKYFAEHLNEEEVEIHIKISIFMADKTLRLKNDRNGKNRGNKMG